MSPHSPIDAGSGGSGLAVLFPTKQLPHTAPSVAEVWVAEWLGVWGRLTNCSYWDGHWMYLLARAVKDDWKGEQGHCTLCEATRRMPGSTVINAPASA